MSSSKWSTLDKDGNSVLVLHMGLSEYFDDERLSDLIIRSRTKAYKAHKIVMCCGSIFFRNALKGPFKEANHGEIDLTHKDPAIVFSLMRFMYCGSYKLPNDVSHIGFHAAMYALGDEYGIDTLRHFALRQYTDMIQRHCFNVGELLCIVPSICGLLLPQDSSLRDPLAEQIAEEFPIVFEIFQHTNFKMQLDCAQFTLKEILDACPESAVAFGLASSHRISEMWPVYYSRDNDEDGKGRCMRCKNSSKENKNGSKEFKEAYEETYCHNCRHGFAKGAALDDWDVFFENMKRAMGLDTLENNKLPQYEDWDEYVKLRDEEYEASKVVDDGLPLFDSWPDYLPVVQPHGFKIINSENTPRNDRGIRRCRREYRRSPRWCPRGCCGCESCHGRFRDWERKRTSWIQDFLYEPMKEDPPIVEGAIPFYYGRFFNCEAGRKYNDDDWGAPEGSAWE
ncbi:hypothetical protein NA57DRAFT_80266 [Rhizodiscina lignyota]|uniref:BTB domain-containing protein n=1 Tax=Rhizodiscina lignyota TaxID=1504668 RepID=A0A9P4I6P1_9PEZI|nr:hypothetical protein NA57DRAFT_80266 [Rhizodiscina lignyota]